MVENWVVPAGGWEIASLTGLFASDPEALGDVDVTVEPGSDVLRVTLKERGDLDVLMTVSGDQVLCSVLLAPCDRVPARTQFERRALSIHKLIPLSSFGITTIDGTEWYELFGALSARSDADALVQEVAVLATNAVEAGGEPA